MNTPNTPGKSKVLSLSARIAGVCHSSVGGSFLALAALLVPAALTVPPVAQAQSPVRQLPDFTQLVEQTGGAVVNIRTTERAGKRQGPQGLNELIDPNDPFYEFFRRFFPPGAVPGMPQGPQGPQERQQQLPGSGQEIPRGLGSGFIISQDGYLLTNHHVVDGADEIYVTLTDKREFKGKLIGSDKNTDVALIKIDAQQLPVLAIGDPNQVRVGEWVLAIGSPFGLENTVTAGIVSAKARETGDYLPFIQTDVAVNPGNSGGPLIDMNGRVIGINSQIYSRTGGFMGISFAIPIDEAMRVSDQLKAKGRVVRGRIGVAITEVTKEIAEPLGLEKPMGAQVSSVEKGGPASRGGLEAGDIILKFDGRTVERSSDLPRLVGNTQPGTKVQIEVWRQGQTENLNVVVGEIPTEKAAAAQQKSEEQTAPTKANWLGIVAADLSAEQRQRQGVQKGGVLIASLEPGGIAAQAGLREGDVLLQLNSRHINSASQFEGLLSKLDRKRTLVLLVKRGADASYVPIRP
ncbi:MAG: DegQ family serine endoprotease [Lautropia sp.]|nr:DegQ family serine endoprotease [Lautropia sp.]